MKYESSGPLTRPKAPRRALLLFLGLWMLLGLAACNSGDLTLAEVDPEAVPLEPGYQDVRLILERSCVPCHNSGKPLPRGTSGGSDGGGVLATAEDDPDYDTCEGIIADPVGLLSTVLDESMPPGAWPRLTEAEKLTLVRWVETSLLTGKFTCGEVTP
jgi:hypothetical protein